MPQITNKQIINAFDKIGARFYPAQPWALMTRASIRIDTLSLEGAEAEYRGHDIATMPYLKPHEKSALLQELGIE